MNSLLPKNEMIKWTLSTVQQLMITKSTNGPILVQIDLQYIQAQPYSVLGIYYNLWFDIVGCSFSYTISGYTFS